MASRANANKPPPACSQPLQELASQTAGVSRAPQVAPDHAVAAWPRLRYARANAPVAQLDRALPSEGRGQGFESLRARQLRTKSNTWDDVSRSNYQLDSGPARC